MMKTTTNQRKENNMTIIKTISNYFTSGQYILDLEEYFGGYSKKYYITVNKKKEQ